MRMLHLNYIQSEKVQDVLSPRKLNMCRRSPELGGGGSTFERKILVKSMAQCKEKVNGE